MKISERQFREMLDRYLEGSASAEERALLDAFFDSYKSEDAVPNEAARQDILKTIHARIHDSTVTRRGKTIGLWLPVAAVISIFVLVILFRNDIDFVREDVTASTVIEHTTRTGERITTELPDGSTVYLNGDSKIKYPEGFGSNIREVQLYGEAYFEVKKNSRPFVVHTQQTRTIVLGTSFNVKNRTTESVEITLVEGKVDVTTQTGVSSVLSPGHHAAVDLKSGQIHTRQVDVLAYVGWKDNVLYFEQTPLKDAITTIEDWYGVRIDLKNAVLQDCLITAKYQNEPLGNVLSSLQFLLNLKIRRLDNAHYTIDGKGCK